MVVLVVVVIIVVILVVIIVVVVVVEIGEAVAQILAGVWVAWVLLGNFAVFSPRMIEQKITCNRNVLSKEKEMIPFLRLITMAYL